MATRTAEPPSTPERRPRPADLQRLGGLAALLMAGTFVVGIAVFIGVLLPAGYFEADPAGKVAVLAENQAISSISYLAAFVVFGLLLVVLSLALYERLNAGAPVLAQVGTAYGLIWAGLVVASGTVANVGVATVVDLYGTDPARAGALWEAVETVQLGVGGGNEVAGSVWVLLISWAALRAGELPRVLNYLGVTLGVVGLLTVVPALQAVGFAFGLGLVAWFVGVGLALLGGPRPARS